MKDEKLLLCVQGAPIFWEIEIIAEKTYFFIRDLVIAQLVGKDLWDFWNVEDPLKMLNQIFKNNDKEKMEPRLIGELGKNTIEAVYYIGLFSNKEFIGAGKLPIYIYFWECI